MGKGGLEGQEKGIDNVVTKSQKRESMGRGTKL